MKHLFSYWHIDFLTMLFIIACVIIYFIMVNGKLRKQSLYFFASMFVLIIAVASPLHFLGMNYLFSAHMVSHILILLIAAPLVLVSIPKENRFSKSLLFFAKKIHHAPVVSWLIGVGIMWLWHIPSVFNTMFAMHDMNNGGLHFLPFIHAASLLIAGMLFCWPIINPYTQYRIAPMQGVVYLSVACVFCSLLGLLITFAPLSTYNYAAQMDVYGFASIIKNQWGISASVDRQMAGLIMWVPCCFIYLMAIMFLFKKWYSEKDVINRYAATNIIL